MKIYLFISIINKLLINFYYNYFIMYSNTDIVKYFNICYNILYNFLPNNIPKTCNSNGIKNDMIKPKIQKFSKIKNNQPSINDLKELIEFDEMILMGFWVSDIFELQHKEFNQQLKIIRNIRGKINFPSEVNNDNLDNLE